ncbi:MAG: GNAT family N-acetyltransferase [Chloroflexi bacterium]|nr:MAG: GNAT family N-acetyltransferase [Chloroflexota bacterium]
MANDLIPREIDLNSAGDDFWRRYHAFRRVRHDEVRPEDPFYPDELERMRILSDQKFEVNHAFEVVHDDEMVSWFRSAVTKPGAPGYDTNRYFLWCTFSVLAPYRRRGIARSHLPLLLELMDRDGCRTVTLESEEESGHAFLQWLGADKKSEGAENRLHIPDVDWPMMQRWIDEGAKGSPETKLEVYDDHIPDAMLEEFAPQLSALLNTMPWDDLDHGDIVETPEILRHEYERMDLAGLKHHTVLTREPNGVISGMTDITWAPHRPTMLVQLFTGVRPDARGRGIGKWIKAFMLDRVHRLYPDAEWISTGNADSNGPMLAINKRMGFKRHRWGAEYQITRDNLAERVQVLV